MPRPFRTDPNRAARERSSVMAIDLGAIAVNGARDPVHGAMASACLPGEKHLQTGTARLQDLLPFVFKQA
ncbi:hypothetical protein V6Z90_006236 [Aspergillus fumigatus]